MTLKSALLKGCSINIIMTTTSIHVVVVVVIFIIVVIVILIAIVVIIILIVIILIIIIIIITIIVVIIVIIVIIVVIVIIIVIMTFLPSSLTTVITVGLLKISLFECFLYFTGSSRVQLNDSFPSLSQLKSSKSRTLLRTKFILSGFFPVFALGRSGV